MSQSDSLVIADSAGASVEFGPPLTGRRSTDSFPDEEVVAALQSGAAPAVWLTVHDINRLHDWCAQRLAENWKALS